MQSTIAEPGIIDIHYRCDGCPAGCELIDHQMTDVPAVMHQTHCHRFPSVVTAWKKIA